MRRLLYSLLVVSAVGMTGCYHTGGMCDCEPERCNCPAWGGVAENGTASIILPNPQQPKAPANSDKGGE